MALQDRNPFAVALQDWLIGKGKTGV